MNRLIRKGELSKLWLASHCERKLSKTQLLSTNLPTTINALLTNTLCLRLSGQLLLGLVRIYSRQVRYLLEDCNEAIVHLKVTAKKAVIDLPERPLSLTSVTVDQLDIMLPLPALQIPQTPNRSPSNQLSQRSDLFLRTPSRLSLTPSQMSFRPPEMDLEVEEPLDIELPRDIGLDLSDIEQPRRAPSALNSPQVSLNLNPDAEQQSQSFDLSLLPEEPLLAENTQPNISIDQVDFVAPKPKRARTRRAQVDRVIELDNFEEVTRKVPKRILQRERQLPPVLKALFDKVTAQAASQQQTQALVEEGAVVEENVAFETESNDAGQVMDFDVPVTPVRSLVGTPLGSILGQDEFALTPTQPMNDLNDVSRLELSIIQTPQTPGQQSSVGSEVAEEEIESNTDDLLKLVRAKVAENESVEFTDLVEQKTKKCAAAAFYNLLTLTSKGVLDLDQREDGCICVSLVAS